VFPIKFDLDKGSFIRVMQNIQMRLDRLKDASAEGLLDGAKRIEAQAIGMTPIQKGSGLLIEAWDTKQISDNANEVVVEISNDATAENRRWRHPFSAHENPNTGNARYPRASTVGRPEFLKVALDEGADELIRTIESHARKALV